MLNEIIIGVLVIVVLFEAIMVSAISQRCKESKRELKKLLKKKQQIEEPGKQCVSDIVDKER